jgi:hypothetical protein
MILKNRKEMNKLKYILGIIMVMAIASCTDFVEPAIPYKGFDTGVFLRTITATSTVPYSSRATASFDLTVEAVDAENGGQVQSVDIFVSRRRGAAVLPEKKAVTIDKAAFTTTSESKYLRANISITIAQAMTALGLTTADLEGGDYVEFRLVLTTTSGRTFSNNTISSDIAGGVFYRSPFFYRVQLVCATSIEKPEGTWKFDMVDTYGDGWQGGFIQVLVGGVEVDRIFLLSQYDPGGVPVSSGSDTYTYVGPGTLSFVWDNDDYNSECEFKITSPSGNVVADVKSPTAGPIKLDLCKE